MEDAPKIAQNSKVRMSRYMDTSATTQVANILGRHWRSSGSSWTKFARTPTLAGLVGKTVRGGSVGTWIISTELGVYLFIENKNYSYRYTWMTFKWLERSKIWCGSLCGSNWWNLSIVGNERHFLTMYIWDVLHVNANRTELILIEHRKMFESRISAGATEKYQGWRNFTQNRRVVLRHGRACSKMRWEILRTSE